MTRPVVVVGGGLAGLSTAYLLAKEGIPSLLLEASPRVGGRVHGVHDAAGALLADLGPTWVWPQWQPVIGRWLDRLELSTFPQFNAGEALADGWGDAPQRCQLPMQEGMERVVGGPSAMVAALLAALPPTAIRINTPVVAIREDAHGALAVALANGDEVRAGQVVVAAPLRVVADQIEIPALNPSVVALMRATPTWMSTHAKVAIIYDTPFWRAEGLSGRVASRTGPLGEIHDNSPSDGRCGALFGFSAWPASERQADPARFQREILAQLARCFGERARAPRELVVEDWAQQPRICAAADRASTSVHPDIGPSALRRAHLSGSLRFAVSECAEQSPGLIAGAFEAAEHAVAFF